LRNIGDNWVDYITSLMKAVPPEGLTAFTAFAHGAPLLAVQTLFNDEVSSVQADDEPPKITANPTRKKMHKLGRKNLGPSHSHSEE
jgi:hypothetical protein